MQKTLKVNFTLGSTDFDFVVLGEHILFSLTTTVLRSQSTENLWSDVWFGKVKFFLLKKKKFFF